MPFSINTNNTSVKTPFIFFGELTSGLFHLSSDLAHALGVSEEGPCHLEDVIYPRIINDSDRENLKINIASLASGKQSTMLQHVRLRVENICVWAAIRAHAYASESGGNILLSGSFEFFSFRYILGELLEHSDFRPEEIEVLKTVANAPRDQGLGFVRLESESVPDALLPDMTRLIVAALANDVPQIVSAHLFDSTTILFTCRQPTLDFEHTIARLVEDILRAYEEDFVSGAVRERAVVVYDSMWHSTEKIARSLVDGFLAAGIPAQLMDLKENHISNVMDVFLDCRYVCVGSPTLNSQMLPTVASFLTYMKGLSPKNEGRVGLAFGSYGWAPLGPNNVGKELEAAGFQLPEKTFAVNWIPSEEKLAEARDLVAKLVAAE